MGSAETRFHVDPAGFLVDFADWTEDFAREMAPQYGIPDGLTDRHWQVIRFIRDTFETYLQCPLVYQTCRANRLSLRDLQTLFPSGYLRGACRLAGITYHHGYHSAVSAPHAVSRPHAEPEGEPAARPAPRTYTTDVHGFLTDPGQWDEGWARLRARDLKMPELTEQHWQVIRSMRVKFEGSGATPTVYETCADNQLELEDLERLFPDGYQRGAVRLAGLRVI